MYWCDKFIERLLVELEHKYKLNLSLKLENRKEEILQLVVDNVDQKYRNKLSQRTLWNFNRFWRPDRLLCLAIVIADICKILIYFC